ncbi:hypothetical protein TNIN_428921 [Trichonephila inaurata madagascariensis]|uniref:Uncharacterized protein n=1 Tax=Trichonephila inaurata madagascariensis TaxID=2747483 RepID=A0A8X6IW19_9ARAC|nr:hypothetical protein TNIN_428921 [Trichonephila inaurata madagascariensis]
MNPELSHILEPEKGPLKGMKQGHAASRDEVDVCLYARLINSVFRYTSSEEQFLALPAHHFIKFKAVSKKIGSEQALNSKDYEDVLVESLFITLDVSLVTSGEYIFQQNNASIHNLSSTKPWYPACNAQLRKWPSRSVDLNPTKNLWSILLREICGKGKTCNH